MGRQGAPSKKINLPSSARRATSDNSAAINQRSAPRRRRGHALDAVEPSPAPSRRKRPHTLTAHRSQRAASPFTQFALTGCALLLVGLGLLQIFGTMVTVKARDETKKKQ